MAIRVIPSRVLPYAVGISVSALMYLRAFFPPGFMELVLFLALLVAAGFGLRDGVGKNAFIVFIVAGALLFSVVLSTLLSPFRDATWILVLTVLNLSLYLLFYLFLSRNNNGILSIKIIAIASFLMSLLGILSVFLHYSGIGILDSLLYRRDAEFVRLTGFLDGPNYFAMTLFLGFISAFFLRKNGVLYRVISFVVLIAIALTLSRGVMLGLVVVLVLFLFLERRARAPAAALSFFLAIVLGGLVILPGSGIEGVRRAVEARIFDSGGGISDRLEVSSGALTALFNGEFWLLGYGRWDFQAAGYQFEAHNSYVTIITDHGLVGLLAYLLFFTLCAYICCRRRSDVAFFAPVFFGLLAILFVNDYHLYKEWWLSLSIVTATWRPQE